MTNSPFCRSENPRRVTSGNIAANRGAGRVDSGGAPDFPTDPADSAPRGAIVFDRRGPLALMLSLMASEPIHLAVNGTLMRGLELNPNLLAAGAEFVREDATVPVYRLYSINDRHPAMVRVAEGGVAVAVEVWAVPPEGLASILLKEPPGLSIGKVSLASGAEVLGVLGEPILCAGQREITAFGGWRAYVAAR